MILPYRSLRFINATTSQAALGDDSDEDSVFGADDDDESDEDSDEDDSSRPVLKGRAKWLKKAVPDKKPKPLLGPAVAKEVKVDGKEVLSKREKKITKTEKTAEEKDKKWHVDNDMTEDVLDKKITELVSSRGRKANNVFETLRKLEVLSKVARLFGPRKEIPVLMHLVSAMYDSHRVIDDFMELQEWRTCYRCLTRIVTVLNTNKELVLGLMPTEDVTDLVLATQIKSDFNKNKTDTVVSDDSAKNVIKVVGSLEQLLLRLEDEYTKSLQQTNPHTQVGLALHNVSTIHTCTHPAPTLSRTAAPSTALCGLRRILLLMRNSVWRCEPRGKCGSK